MIAYSLAGCTVFPFVAGPDFFTLKQAKGFCKISPKFFAVSVNFFFATGSTVLPDDCNCFPTA